MVSGRDTLGLRRRAMGSGNGMALRWILGVPGCPYRRSKRMGLFGGSQADPDRARRG